MQPQALLVPIDMAPDQLPPSVSQFLSHSLDIPLDYWMILKTFYGTILQLMMSGQGRLVTIPSTACPHRRNGYESTDKDAFRIHGKKCGLSEYLYHHTNTEWQVTSVLLQRQGPSTPINATARTQSVFVQHKSYL